MLRINTITNNPSQKMNIKLENGQPLQFSLWYSYTQQGWFYTFTYGTYTSNNRRMVNSLNMIRQIRNIVPFGLACLVTDSGDPIFINDFQNARATLYTLNSTDVSLVENILTQQNLTLKP